MESCQKSLQMQIFSRLIYALPLRQYLQGPIRTHTLPLYLTGGKKWGCTSTTATSPSSYLKMAVDNAGGGTILPIVAKINYHLYCFSWMAKPGSWTVIIYAQQRFGYGWEDHWQKKNCLSEPFREIVFSIRSCPVCQFSWNHTLIYVFFQCVAAFWRNIATLLFINPALIRMQRQSSRLLIGGGVIAEYPLPGLYAFGQGIRQRLAAEVQHYQVPRLA